MERWQWILISTSWPHVLVCKSFYKNEVNIKSRRKPLECPLKKVFFCKLFAFLIQISVCFSTEVSTSEKITENIIILLFWKMSAASTESYHISQFSSNCYFVTKLNSGFIVRLMLVKIQMFTTTQMLKAWAWLFKTIATAISPFTWNGFWSSCAWDNKIKWKGRALITGQRSSAT